MESKKQQQQQSIEVNPKAQRKANGRNLGSKRDWELGVEFSGLALV
jgi:hypothetical protein